MSFATVSRTSLLVAAATGVGACHHAAASAGSAAMAKPASAPAVAPAARMAAPKLPAGVTLAMVTLGDSVFNNGPCVRCHGKGAVGATNAPALANKAKWDHGTGSYEDILKTITTGVPKDQIKDASRPFAMGAMGGRTPITADQAAAAAAYVWSLNHAVK